MSYPHSSHQYTTQQAGVPIPRQSTGASAIPQGSWGPQVSPRPDYPQELTGTIYVHDIAKHYYETNVSIWKDTHRHIRTLGPLRLTLSRGMPRIRTTPADFWLRGERNKELVSPTHTRLPQVPSTAAAPDNHRLLTIPPAVLSNTATPGSSQPPITLPSKHTIRPPRIPWLSPRPLTTSLPTASHAATVLDLMAVTYTHPYLLWLLALHTPPKKEA